MELTADNQTVAAVWWRLICSASTFHLFVRLYTCLYWYVHRSDFSEGMCSESELSFLKLTMTGMILSLMMEETTVPKIKFQNVITQTRCTTDYIINDPVLSLNSTKISVDLYEDEYYFNVFYHLECYFEKVLYNHLLSLYGK